MPRHGLQARAQQLLLCLSLRFHCAHCLFPLCHPLAERRCVSIAALLIDLDGTLHKTPPSGALSASPGRGGGGEGGAAGGGAGRSKPAARCCGGRKR